MTLQRIWIHLWSVRLFTLQNGLLASMPCPILQFQPLAPRVSMLAPTWLMANINSLSQSLDQKSLSKTATALEKRDIWWKQFPPSKPQKARVKNLEMKCNKTKRTIGNIYKYYHFWTYKWSFKLFLFEFFLFDPTTFLFPPYSLYGFHGFPLNVSLTFPTCCLVHDTKLHASYSSLKHSRKRFGF